MTTTMEVQPKLTTAFYVQAAVSFAVSVTAMAIGITNINTSGWVRGFLIVTLLYVVTATFTLSKCVRDHQESSQVVQRVDQVRLERYLAEHDPFKAV